MRGSYIYKHLDVKGDIIYIGQTINMKQRQCFHLKNSEWSKEINKILFAFVKNKKNMDVLEKYYINLYTPKYNIIDNSKQSDMSWLNNSIKNIKFYQYKKQKYKGFSKCVDYWKDKYIDNNYNIINRNGIKSNNHWIKIIDDIGEPNCMCCDKPINNVYGNKKYNTYLKNKEFNKIWNTPELKNELEEICIDDISILCCDNCYEKIMNNKNSFLEFLYENRKNCIMGVDMRGQ